jgi:hypothetical protein
MPPMRSIIEYAISGLLDLKFKIKNHYCVEMLKYSGVREIEINQKIFFSGS